MNDLLDFLEDVGKLCWFLRRTFHIQGGKQNRALPVRANRYEQNEARRVLPYGGELACSHEGGMDRNSGCVQSIKCLQKLRNT